MAFTFVTPNLKQSHTDHGVKQELEPCEDQFQLNTYVLID